MLLGRYDSKISSKFQISYPVKFRKEMGEKLIATKGLENCLIIVSEEGWKTLLEGTEGQPFTSKPTRQVQRYLLGNAQQIELDSKGRFILPEYLRTYANLAEDVVFAGIERFVEVWDKNTWEEEQKRLMGSIETIAEKLSNPAQKDTDE
ncbi:MAG TPA: division/cell wall cluster transcriptional repressor MraZ [Patescibacteria group bacterium]|nr:division/cell wall cluster transcriptional repressor MraZ [Patescibacteria group bacterium]